MQMTARFQAFRIVPSGQARTQPRIKKVQIGRFDHTFQLIAEKGHTETLLFRLRVIFICWKMNKLSLRL
jgi:hypothetical protein